MANITKRNGKYRVRVHRNGTCLSDTFTVRADAVAWGRQKEIELERQDLPADHRKLLKGSTLGGLCERYRDHVSIRKKSWKNEQSALNKFLRHPICAKAVVDVRTSDFAAYRDERLAEVTPISLKRELAIIRNVYTIAAKEWGVAVVNPLDKLSLHAPPVVRDRRLEDGELERIVAEASNPWRNKLLLPVILWQLQTAMRLSETLALEWRDVDLRKRIVTIRDSKNGHPRRIPLTLQAVDILEGLDPVSDKVFAINSQTFKSTWQRMIKKLEIKDLRLHDCRREAISNLFELGLSVPQVQLVSGHRQMSMLQVYTKIKPQDLFSKLDRAVQL
jgi:integrase